MTIYEKERLRLREELDTKLAELDESRDIIGDKVYWKRVGEINSEYSSRVKEVDDAERSRRSMIQAEEHVKHDRPEQTYVDILGQLKAEKLTQLINKLAMCGASKESVDINDPFYLDKVDPLSVFEKWWDEELVGLPSVDEIRDFLRRVDINSKGYITFNSNDIDTAKSSSYKLISDKSIRADSNYNNILKSDVINSRNNAKQKKELAISRAKRAVPLLSRKDPEAYLKKQNKIRKARQRSYLSDSLIDIVYAYGLDPDLESLLIEHIQNVCVLKGITRADQYRPMLEQFLRYVKDPQERLRVVRQAIDRNWRVLSNGSI